MRREASKDWSAKGTLDDEASCRRSGRRGRHGSEALNDTTLRIGRKIGATSKTEEEDSSSSDSDSDDDANKVHPEAHEERDRQAFYNGGGAVRRSPIRMTKALPARVDASTRIASVARGRQTRAVIKEIWRQADVLADDELTADAAARPLWLRRRLEGQSPCRRRRLANGNDAVRS